MRESWMRFTRRRRTLPKRAAQPTRPWINATTLDMIDRRNRARTNHGFHEERSLTEQIRKSAACDCGMCLDELLASGSCDEVRKLRKGFSPKQGRLNNAGGEAVSSEYRAETLAEYLERVQWTVRPMTPGVAPQKDERAPRCEP